MTVNWFPSRDGFGTVVDDNNYIYNAYRYEEAIKRWQTVIKERVSLPIVYKIAECNEDCGLGDLPVECPYCGDREGEWL